MLSEPSLTLLKETSQQILVPEDQTDSLLIGWFPSFSPASWPSLIYNTYLDINHSPLHRNASRIKTSEFNIYYTGRFQALTFMFLDMQQQGQFDMRLQEFSSLKLASFVSLILFYSTKVLN